MTRPSPPSCGIRRLCVTGDVMTGRGIDQVLPRPCDPAIPERYMRSATGYVELAEQHSGAFDKPVNGAHIWGSLPRDLDVRGCALRIVNLETAITNRGRPAPKEINYRMSPENASILASAGITACTLANNHVMDWGEQGLLDTLDVLDRLGVKHAGAGKTMARAAAPLILDHPDGRRVLVSAFGDVSAGVPRHWEAGADRPGVVLLPGSADAAIASVRVRLDPLRHPDDIFVVSLHWGGNWGYDIPQWQRRMAHAFIDEADADLVVGHSSHHAKGMEIHRGRLILYGCGDLVNDYEGIGGYEGFRPDLGLAFCVDLEAATGRLAALEVIVYQRRQFGLVNPGRDAVRRLADMFARESRLAGWRVDSADRSILLRKGAAPR
ncbi:CapA family protein [Roseovarius sp. SYSU LYC5161]|uniref:CapA family protein n=1 Tax=Roseovarius halophilus (ex Wu et al. 2025) TaxID=3376060 RepID=UPI00399BADDE